MVVINVMARMYNDGTSRYQDEVTVLAYGMVSKCWTEYQDVVEVVVVDDASVAKMSGSDVVVEPYLDSRNTKGYRTTTQILKDRSGNTCWVVRRVSNVGGMRKW